MDDFHWLLSGEAAGWLELAATEAEPSVGLTGRLRRELSAERTHLVLQQAALRHRAREKFAAAERMFFTPLGLEQATDERIAAYKAERFDELIRKPSAQQSAGSARFADLCCGIGGDLMALAGRAATVGVDRDPVAALFAEANLAVAGGTRTIGGASVCVGDVGAFVVAQLRAWHIDPDRRPAGRRTTRVVLHDPPPEIIERLLADCPHAAVKLAPAAELPEGWSSRAELEWISSRRECRQLVAWFGDLAAYCGTRRATILLPSGERRTFGGPADLEVPVADSVGRYVFEPDASILAAGLCGALAAEFRLAAITPRVAYLTGEPTAEAAAEALHDPAMACFEVQEVLPLRIKAVRDWLRERGIGRVEVKKRGVEADPHRLAAELRGRGDDQATLLICTIRGRMTCIIARRV